MASLAVEHDKEIAYYARKLQDAECRFQVVQTDTKGKIILATEDIPKDTILYKESPVVAMQSLDNKFDVVVCHFCKCNIGTVEQQIDLLRRKTNRVDYLQYKQTWALLENQGKPAKSANG